MITLENILAFSYKVKHTINTQYSNFMNEYISTQKPVWSAFIICYLITTMNNIQSLTNVVYVYVQRKNTLLNKKLFIHIKHGWILEVLCYWKEEKSKNWLLYRQRMVGQGGKLVYKDDWETLVRSLTVL